MPSIICRSTAGSLRPLPAICSASKIAGYKNVRFVPRSTCGFTKGAKKISYIRNVDPEAYAYLVESFRLLQSAGYFVEGII